MDCPDYTLLSGYVQIYLFTGRISTDLRLIDLAMPIEGLSGKRLRAIKRYQKTIMSNLRGFVDWKSVRGDVLDVFDCTAASLELD
jgi:hypothetical protein